MRFAAFFRIYRIIKLTFLKFGNSLQISQNLQNFAKLKKIQLDNLVDFEKCCKTHILNYFLAKIGADTAENEQYFAEILPKRAALRGAAGGGRAPGRGGGPPRLRRGPALC